MSDDDLFCLFCYRPVREKPHGRWCSPGGPLTTAVQAVRRATAPLRYRSRWPAVAAAIRTTAISRIAALRERDR